jgi:hypothetical protein
MLPLPIRMSLLRPPRGAARRSGSSSIIFRLHDFRICRWCSLLVA